MAKITTDKTNERVGRTVNGSTKKYADEKARAEINDIFTDAAYMGSGLGTCSTDAATAAKTATLLHYLLLKNMPVSIRFTNGINVAGATLDINSQGAKPIFVDGAALQPGVVRPGMTVTFCYDGTNYNITGMKGLEQSASPSDLYVDMGLPSGLLWAKANIDVTTDSGFQEVDGAVSPYKYECSFVSWGNTEMFNPTNTSAFAHDFGSANDGPYASTPGASIMGNISPSFDAARANLGAPWRMPTSAENQELINNCDFVQADGTTAIPSDTTDKRVTVNSILGIYLKSKVNGNRLFFPASGNGNGPSWNARGSYGYYWSSTLYSAANGRLLNFYSGGVNPQGSNYRFNGFPVRPVQ